MRSTNEHRGENQVDNPKAQGRIMIVEDSIATAVILSKMLGQKGYRTDIFHDGQSALEKIDIVDPDLIVADWMMPRMTGVELCRTIKDNPRLSRIYVIILTSLSGKIEETLGSDIRADDYMVKPFNKKEILARVNSGMRIATLQKRLYQSLEKLEAQNQELMIAEKMAAVGVLVAGIAHEINNPLAIISNAQQLIERDVTKIFNMLKYLEDLLSGDQRNRLVEDRKKEIQYDYVREDLLDSLKYGLKGIERIKSIIQRLQVFQSQDFIKFEPFALNRSMETALDTTKDHFFPETTLVKDLRSSAPVLGNFEQLVIVFSNILTNAAEAVKRQGGRVAVSTFDDERLVHCIIEDNGYGIPDNIKKRVYDPFFTTKKIGEGLGLGLTTAYYLLRLHHAKIMIDSSPQKGTIIEITFERADAGTGKPHKQ